MSTTQIQNTRPNKASTCNKVEFYERNKAPVSSATPFSDLQRNNGEDRETSNSASKGTSAFIHSERRFLSNKFIGNELENPPQRQEKIRSKAPIMDILDAMNFTNDEKELLNCMDHCSQLDKNEKADAENAIRKLIDMLHILIRDNQRVSNAINDIVEKIEL